MKGLDLLGTSIILTPLQIKGAVYGLGYYVGKHALWTEKEKDNSVLIAICKAFTDCPMTT